MATTSNPPNVHHGGRKVPKSVNTHPGARQNENHAPHPFPSGKPPSGTKHC